MAKVVILAWDPDLTQNDPNHHFWVILGQIVGIVVIRVIPGQSCYLTCLDPFDHL